MSFPTRWGTLPPFYNPIPVLWNWIKYKIDWWGWPKFKPGVFYNEDLKLTEILLEDTCTVWHPWGPYKGHAVDCGYDSNGKLIGIKIWDDVRFRDTIKTYSRGTHP